MEFSELVQRFAAAAASGDGDALADLFTPDGIYDDYFFGPSSGRDAIKTMLAHFSDGGRNFRWEFFDPVQSGSVAYASYRFSFESKRPEAKGARVMFDGIGRFDLGAPHPPLFGGVRSRHGARPAGVRAGTSAQDRPQIRGWPEGAARVEGSSLTPLQPTRSARVNDR